MYKKRRKKEFRTNVIGIIILIVIIAILATYLMNKKEATDVSSDESNLLSGVTANNTEENKTNRILIVDSSNTVAEATPTVEITPTDTPTLEITPTKVTTPTKNITATPTPTKAPTATPTKAPSPTTKPQSTNSGASKNEIINSKISELNAKITTERQGVIYLTFDDGPSAKITPKVLDILKEQNVKATFFVINFSSGNEYLIKRIVDEGHTIGIHGYSHEYSKIYKSKETFLDNVYTLQKRIKDVTGVTSTYTRFPGGSSNTVSKKYCKGIMSELTLEMIDKGFKYFDWNISSGDAGGAKNSKDVYNNVTKNLKKTRQNMVLMHDFSSNQKGLDALKDIIKFGKDNGYTFMKVDDQTPFFAQHVSN